MKIAIISDVHANLEALTTCLKKIDELGADKIICLGDLVDYCAEPNACIELIKTNCDVVVMGNHDEAQFKYDMTEGFSNDARISSIHTRDVIKPEYTEYFKTLPRVYRYENLLFVHGSPQNPKDYRYIPTTEAAESSFVAFDESICFIGHSHKPVIFKETKQGVQIVTDEYQEAGHRYIINVGSVGQPRDGDPRLSFGLFDLNSRKYTNYRVEYDTLTASNKIKNEGLPLYLAERIINGV
ncbi:MAG: metallophosphoesterase family protein [Ignavibacteria bacterium]